MDGTGVVMSSNALLDGAVGALMAAEARRDSGAPDATLRHR
ncbi:hypothetical protein N9188_00140 [bacterium]|nr:hypothetical protein [bacterium]MDB4453829.1 hypothetical protein [bacterium]